MLQVLFTILLRNFSRSLGYSFLTAGQNNFGNKILFLHIFTNIKFVPYKKMKLVHIVDFYQIFRKCDKTELDMQYTHKSKTIHI